MDLINVETLVLIVTAILLIRYYIHRKWQVLKKLNIPHNPPSIRMLGNIAENAKDPDLIFKGQLALKQKFGKIYGAYNGLNPQISISDPKILKQIYIKEFSNFSQRSNSFKLINGEALNTGVNVVSGRQWKRVRNTISPSFSSSKLREMFQIVENCVDATVNRLQKVWKENNGRFDSKEVFSRLSLDVICSAAFSTNVNVQNDDDKPPQIIEAAKKAFDFSVVGKPWFILVFMFPWIEKIISWTKFSVFPRETISFFTNLVDHLLKGRTSNNQKRRTDLMQLMLEAKISNDDVKNGASKGLTRLEIVGNSMIMMLAGFETTSNAMIFLAFNLATHQDVQEKLFQELKSATDEDEKITFEIVSKMKYLEMCINETLRLYPLIPRNSRYASEEITIDGITIPKHTLVDVPVYALSHDEEYWEKPFEFNPERMADMSKVDPIVFQPFGAGPRNCVGMRFALLEIKVAFCKILQKFKFDVCSDTPKPPLEMTFKASMKPKDTVHLQVIARGQTSSAD